MRRRFGFTLIEILVVIAILGILVSISSLVWGSVAARGRDNTRKTDLARIKNVLEQYSTDNRAYPTYDTSKGRIYAATWQLDNTNAECSHDDRINLRLINESPKTNYISSIPTDPKRRLEFGAGCSTKQDQHSMYLYLSSPAGTNGQGPSATSSANGYALLATLEQSAGRTPDADNPLKSSVGKFSYYFASGQLSDYKFDANYVIFGGSTR